jgi:NAD(P)-dependent dehydrogenase (short-subunit alcohol dehydrogenase family)
MPSTVYLVSGANRGIGKLSAVKDISGHRALTSLNTGLGLVKALAARADTVVFAGARDPASASELRELADQKKNVHILKLVSCDEDGNCAAVEEIKRVAGALHVVIANAGENTCNQIDYKCHMLTDVMLQA